MIEADHFRDLVIRPTLEYWNLYSEAAENLVFGTAAQESRFKYLKQIKGPALGFYQCEPDTHVDIWRHYLGYRSKLAAKVRNLAGQRWLGHFIPDEEMIGNLYYSTAICRVHYLRAPLALPEADDIEGLAHYWKKFYNTQLGAGTAEEFIQAYNWANNKEG